MKFLICSDGSEQAERAVRLGAAIAAACQAEVTLLGIMETPGASKSLLVALKRDQSLLEDKKIHAELITKTGNPI
jgi:nucleotide-binding universal stress UspA family protein